MNTSPLFGCVYDRFTTDSESASEHLGGMIDLFIVSVDVDVASGRNVGVPKLLLCQPQTAGLFVDHRPGEMPKCMAPRGTLDIWNLYRYRFERPVNSAPSQSI